MSGFGHTFEAGFFVQREDGFWFSSWWFFKFYVAERPRVGQNIVSCFSLTRATHYFVNGHMFVWTKSLTNIYTMETNFLIPGYDWIFKCNEQLIFVVICEIQNHFSEYKTTDQNNENNILFCIFLGLNPLIPAGPTAPPRAWCAIENVFQEVPLMGGMVIGFCLPLAVWGLERTSYCMDSFFSVICIDLRVWSLQLDWMYGWTVFCWI